MEEEHHNNQVNRYTILDPIYDLSLVKRFIEVSDIVTMYGDLEVEPFQEFSLPFQAVYWYLKYALLKQGEVILDVHDQKALFDEDSLNIIWLTIRNENDTLIECKDGIWYLSLSKLDEDISYISESYKLEVL